MKESAIACFLSAARTGSFSETAHELSMTRQAVSKNIQELEEDVGFPLFFHRNIPLTLTTAGEKMLSYYMSRERDLGVAARIFGKDFFNYRYLRVGWGRWFMPNSSLIDALAEFNATTECKLSVVAGIEKESLENLRTGEADVAFLSKYVCSMLKEPYTAIPLAEEPLGLAVSPKIYMKEDKDIDSIACKLPYLTCPAGEDTESEILGRVHRGLMYFKNPSGEIRILPNLESIQLEVALGNGFTCLPNVRGRSSHIQVLDMPAREGMRPSVTMCIVWLNRNERQEILALRDWMLDRTEERP